MIWRHLDLFSGIGGNSLAADWVWENVEHTFCEINPYCRKILKQHWPQAKIYEDIRTLSWVGQAPVDIVTGGFPCQPFSVAGKQKGKGDDRDLWPDMLRIIKEARPRWVLGENVAGFVGMELDRSISDLESIGYTVQAFDIPAIAVDARHLRHRIWIVAHADRVDRGLPILPEFGRNAQENTRALGSGSGVADTDAGLLKGSQEEVRTGWDAALNGSTDMADSHGVDGERSDAQGPKGRAKAKRSTRLRGGARRRDHAEWPAEPRVRRVAHGIPDRVDRIKALGNSIVPQVAYEIMLAMRDSVWE